jgi:hypothetical protein
MRVLVGCEFSGVVRDAFIDAGHDAMSCDLLPSESDKGPHMQADIMYVLQTMGEWDLVILHPPCTYMAVSGNRWYGRGQPGHDKRIEALDWTQLLWAVARAHSKATVLENPVSALSGAWRKPRWSLRTRWSHLSADHLSTMSGNEFGICLRPRTEARNVHASTPR